MSSTVYGSHHARTYIKSMSNALKLGLRVAALAALISLPFLFGSWGAVWACIARANAGIVAVAFVLSLATLALNAFKWRLTFPSLRLATMFKIALISQFYSFALLGSASGEVAKIYMLSRISGTVGGSAVSVLADRVTALIGLLIVSVAGFVLSPSNYPHGLREVSLAILAGLILALLALRHRLAFALGESVIARMERSTPALRRLASHTREAIEQWYIAVHHLGRMSAGVVLGGVTHAANALLALMLAREVGITIGFSDWCWIVGLTSIAGFVPIGIGQIATYGTFVALLRLLSVPIADALAVSALLLAIHLGLATIGAILEWRRWQAAATAP